LALADSPVTAKIKTTGPRICSFYSSPIRTNKKAAATGINP
jgi:hypothetical protein